MSSSSSSQSVEAVVETLQGDIGHSAAALARLRR